MEVLQSLEDLQGEEESVDEEYESYLQKNILRDEELIEFVENFINSEEMHFPEKKLAAKNEEVIYDEDSMCSCIECEERFNLVKRGQKLWALERRFEKYVQDKITKQTIKHQERSIKIIREKIAEAKQRYLCHKEERQLLEEKHREAVLEDLKNIYHVNIKFLTLKSKPVEKVLVYNKIRHVQRLKQKERMAGIFRKILNEYRRQRQIDTVKNKRYDTKVVRKEKIRKDLEIVGTKIELLPRHEEKLEEEKKEDVVEIQIEEAVELVEIEPKEKATKVGKKEKDKKPKKQEKKEKKPKGDKASKKGKNDKKGKKAKPENEDVDLVLPYVPITNERHKIRVDEDQKMVDLIKRFEAMDALEDERNQLEIKKELAEGIFYPEDHSFTFSPKIPSFQDFRNGVIYKKRIRILNAGKTIKKCRFYRVCLEEFDPTLIQVQHLDAQLVIPGMFFYVTITFSPETLNKPITGNILFLTYSTNQNDYLQLSVPIFCSPWSSHVSINPDTVVFNTLPIWEARRRCDYKNYKTLKIHNEGKKPCKITITKVRDPFQLDKKTTTDVIGTKHQTTEVKIVEKSVETLFINEMGKQNSEPRTENGDDLFVPAEESNSFVDSILDQCVEYVFNAFTFDCYCFNVDGKSETVVKIYFKNVDYVGSYNEKYSVNVFEKAGGKNLECVESKVQKLRKYGYNVKQKRNITLNLGNGLDLFAKNYGYRRFIVVIEYECMRIGKIV